jgi:Short-chain alcohol dehydrogenase of unknown specificity
MQMKAFARSLTFLVAASGSLNFTQSFTSQAKLLSFLPKTTTSAPLLSSRPSTTKVSTSSTQLLLSNMADSERYSIPDQPARFARAKEQKNDRYLNIESVYDPSYLKGKRVAITGANRGIGLSLAKELVAQGGKLVAIVRSSSEELDALNPDEIITGIDVTSDEACETIAAKIAGGPIDILVNNAGYFYEPVEKIDSLNFKEELKMIDICALGPLRVSANLFNNGLLKEGSSTIAMITSQGGSISWRTTQNPKGKNSLEQHLLF